MTYVDRGSGWRRRVRSSAGHARRLLRTQAPFALALLIAACAAPSTKPPPPPPAPLAAPVVAPQLAAEEHWLAQLFAGTPVAIGPTAHGALRVEVPLKYSFDPGSDRVKRPLAVVLDKVAASLRRQRRARLELAAPTRERSDSVHDALVARGVAGYRIDPLPPRADAVELRLVAPPPAIGSYQDPTATGRRR